MAAAVAVQMKGRGRLLCSRARSSCSQAARDAAARQVIRRARVEGAGANDHVRSKHSRHTLRAISALEASILGDRHILASRFSVALC